MPEIPEITFCKATWIHFQVIDSTNRFLLEADLDQEGTTCTASIQTSGCGRLGRKWASPSGGLYMSLLFFPSIDQCSWPLFSFAAGLAICATIEKHCPEASPKLKWPNDILINGRKVCGILSQCRSSSSAKLVAGIGLNVNSDFTRWQTKQSFPPTSLFMESRRKFPLAEIANTARGSLMEYYSRWLANPGFFPDEWNAKSAFHGKTLLFDADNELKMKDAVILQDGALSGMANGRRTRLHSGSVTAII
jgi:BirA family transcriptional regulator, biotin operon repressor / biotin---[acetyl-CoA-carboxylase] ligase